MYSYTAAPIIPPIIGPIRYIQIFDSGRKSPTSPAAIAGPKDLAKFILAPVNGPAIHISLATISPTASIIGLAVIGRFPARCVAPYIVALIIGAFIVSLCLYGFHPNAGKAIHFGLTLPSAGVSDGATVVIELILTFWLVFIITGVVVDKRAPPG